MTDTVREARLLARKPGCSGWKVYFRLTRALLSMFLRVLRFVTCSDMIVRLGEHVDDRLRAVFMVSACAALAQLVRALVCGTRGPPFNPGRRYQLPVSIPNFMHETPIARRGCSSPLEQNPLLLPSRRKKGEHAVCALPTFKCSESKSRSPSTARTDIDVEQSAAIVLVATDRAVAFQVSVGCAVVGMHSEINGCAFQVPGLLGATNSTVA